MRINESTKVTLTLGQLKKLVKESVKLPPGYLETLADMRHDEELVEILMNNDVVKERVNEFLKSVIKEVVCYRHIPEMDTDIGEYKKELLVKLIKVIREECIRIDNKK